MSFVVTALTPQEKIVMLSFLHAHDVHLPPSGDFQAFGRVSEINDVARRGGVQRLLGPCLHDAHGRRR